jgi:hypothetical protein
MVMVHCTEPIQIHDFRSAARKSYAGCWACGWAHALFQRAPQHYTSETGVPSVPPTVEGRISDQDLQVIHNQSQVGPRYEQRVQANEARRSKPAPRGLPKHLIPED